MSPFAAGCAICGTDLDTNRWDSGPGPLARVGSWLSAFSYGPSKSGMSPWLVLFIVFFGLSMISSLIMYLVYGF